MEVEQMKRQLRELIYRRDMLCYERDSLERDDLIHELNEEIDELREKLKNIALWSPLGLLFLWSSHSSFVLIIVKSDGLIIPEKRGNMLSM